MSSFREYGQKIVGLKGMSRVTRTMKMVAAGHYRKAQNLLHAAQIYDDRLEALCRTSEILAGGPPKNEPGRKARVLVISANRGLCGGYNGNLARTVTAWLTEHGARYEQVSFVFNGKKAQTLLRETCPAVHVYSFKSALPELEQTVRIGLHLLAQQQAGLFEDLYIAYTQSQSAMTAVPVVEQLLPFRTREEPTSKPQDDTLVLPDAAALYAQLARQTVVARIHLAHVHAATAEQAARRMAMENASANIDKLVLHYTLLRNTARQAAITQELTEIVSGAESLKG